MSTMVQMLKHPGWLRLPLLLTVQSTPQGALAELLYVLCHGDGAAAVFEMSAEAIPEEVCPTFAWEDLPLEVLRVLRAGSVIGATFDAALVARLLDEPCGAVLERLQWATDAGAPLVDRGEGRFTIASEAIAALQSRLLPSLRTFWHHRLGDLLRERAESAARAPEAVPAEPWVPSTVEAPQAETPPLLSPERYAELFTPAAQATASEDITPVKAAQPPPRAEHPRPMGTSAGDSTRAAAHLQAAGRIEAAVEQYLAAIRDVAAHGDAPRAYALIEQALPLLDALPSSNRRAVLRAQLWLERGRLQWHGVLLGAPSTLHDALASLETATAALPSDAPAAVRGECAAVTAGICYDLGDIGALQRALVVLTESSQHLLQARELLSAARLLSDQAAIYVRLGDPVRATRFLAQSRELFEGIWREAPHDRVALEELAETDHLLARLPLHIPLRTGREEEAVAVGMEHARAAERTYQRLGQRQQLARVWESMGRLALQGGHIIQAKEHLTAAHTLQRQLGDVTGLARTTAALADLCVRTEQWEDATALLADSVQLNMTKGSLSGLAFNQQALETLVQATAELPGGERTRLRDALAEVEGRLAQAETLFGRRQPPSESAEAMVGAAG
ncbi:MAG: hypothetical protein FJZ47_20625 [Candidatus Tectomicrobia bacterium]|uniref:Tetratricopeptide repeat protein n=1 Tax=Tectimicrobiota bacterium TaxID=2528274 RepID=A0A937W4R6_UNCTE|nr:hypothetical protein [Candidatus Tectomicrobia bacterium]